MSTLLTIKEAVDLTELAESTIRHWLDEGKIDKQQDNKGKTLISKREILMQIPTVLTLFNHKGGCGKTTLSILLADYFALKGYKVIVVDLDPQSNTTQVFFSFEEMNQMQLTLYDFLENKTPLKKIVKSKKYKQDRVVDIIPSNLDCASKDATDTSQLVQYKDDFYPIFKKYNIVIIDCPPALNAFSRLGILLANYIFCPVQAEPFSYKGLGNVIRFIKAMEPFNKDFINYKAVISKHSKRKSVIKEDYVEKYYQELNENIFKGSIPDFTGFIERGISFENIFDMYKGNESVLRIKELMSEIDSFIYEGRG